MEFRRATAFSLILATLLGVTSGCDLVAIEPDVADPPASDSTPTSFRLDPIPVPEAASNLVDAVLFLPLVNRSEWAIHPAWLRAFDRTLAAHAAIFEGRRVIDPDLAGTIALELGFPNPQWWTTASDFAPASQEIARRGRAAGASTVVWGELGADHRVTLHAIGASAEPWTGISVPLEGRRDIAVYEGPRRLLEAIQGRPIAAEPPPASAVEALAAIRAEAVAKDPATLRRVERALAKLAVEHPRWPEPWIELAWIRQLRPLAVIDFYSNWIGEGPSPARHVARLFSGLSGSEKARLGALDLMLTISSRPRSARLSLAVELPPTAWERVALTVLFGGGVEAFSLDRIEPRSLDERAMLASIGAKHADESRERATTLAAGVDAIELMGAPYLISALESKGEHESDWHLFRGASRLNAIHDGAAILEVLRGECADASNEPLPACQEPIRAVLAATGIDASPETLSDPSAWRAALDAWRRASMERTYGSQLVAVPQASIFQEDPAFVVEWILPAELILAANAVMPVAAAARGGLADAAGLLIPSTRERLVERIDRLIDAMHVGPLIQTKRGDHDSVARYSVWNRRFQNFAGVKYWQAYFGQLNDNELEVAAATYEQLAKVDPYDHRWREAWLYWVDYRENISWGDASSERAARSLETLVPRPGFLTRDIARAWGDAGHPEIAMRRFEELEAIVQEPAVRLPQDDHLAALGRPIEERITRIEEALVDSPDSELVLRKLMELEIAAGRFASAEGRARVLVERPSTAEWACSRLVDLAAWQGRAEEGGEILAACASRSGSPWTVARAWVRYAKGLVDRDRFEEAAVAYQAAYDLIGGAGDVVRGMGKLAEITGHTDAAREQYEFLRDQYGNGDETQKMGRWELWELYLRQDRVDDALGEVDRFVRHAWQDNHAWWKLLRTYALKGDIASFESLARARLEKRFEPGPAFGLAQLEAGRGNVDEAVALLNRIDAAKPNQAFWSGFTAEILVDAGRGAEAIDLARKAYEEDPAGTWSAGVYVDALIAAGRVDEAEQIARELAARFPWWANVAPLARVERARGNIDAARDLVARSRRTHSWGNAPWRAEVAWLPFELSLGLPAVGSEELRRLSERIDRTLVRHPLEPELWKARAAVQRHRGDLEGARIASARADRLAGREPVSEQIARNPATNP